MSAYENDDRVQLWPNGLWTVTATVGAEVIDYTLIGHADGTFDAYLGERLLKSISEQGFDEVVYALIGDPQ